ncbi:hypothetical protein EXU57_06675 [Segetibacter sp. 3557_3]|uniref:IPT/TIG domain-containing protein n=1 Tax=Segetibacter sp. 3557_3 TaxID=2547429 RepID=UPI001058B766|nr:IPT/TIG domain-containing protein [Segetibacter sp. 3557_3]TDH27269.1 hypothetical protein EXU57_06675 [Segetibacter sp. 3557_3]
MEVIIKERTYQYTSDYPEGWHFSKGDYFKFPVEIGIHKCFIKRFKIKSPENISGWKFLEQIRGKYAANLPRVHDIVCEQELGTDIYYVFYEYIDGETLHHIIGMHGEINLERLTDDLFNALHSLHQAGFWFADFDERNIFCNRQHSFYLVDIDSVQPLTLRPGADMWGNRDYWVLVLEFYKRILDKRAIVPADIPGDCLNHLQVIFLLLRLRIFYANKEQEYRELFSLLPDYLNELSSRFRSLFENALSAQSTAEYLDDLKLLIRQEILLAPESRMIRLLAGDPQRAVQPVIRLFTVQNAAEKNDHDYIVIRDNAFRITWDVVNASNIELYEDDVLYRQFTNDESSVEIKSSVAQKDVLQYTLLASEGKAKVTSEPITVHFQYNTPVIHDFVLRHESGRDKDAWLVESEQPFELGWNVQFASDIKLFRNSVLIKTMVPAETTIQLAETYDTDELPVTFDLVIANKAGVTTSESVKVKVKRPAPIIVDFYAVNANKGTRQREFQSGEAFLLQWTVLNARNIDLFRNGIPHRSLKPSETGINLVEQPKDRDVNTVTYFIKASNDIEEVQSNELQIRIARPSPVIRSFKANKKRVPSGKPIVFSWEVEHASSLTVYRNGNHYVNLEATGKQLELSEELADGHDQTFEYALVAGNRLTNIKSEPVFVTIEAAKPNTWKRYLPYAAILLFLVLTGVFLNKLFSGRTVDTKVSRIEPAAIYADSSIRIIGGAFSPDQNIRVVFGSTPGEISSRSKKLLVATVPGINNDPAPDSVRVNVFNKGDIIFSAVFPFIPSNDKTNVPLPGTLDEIWAGASGTYLRLDLNRKAIFIASGAKETFKQENIVDIEFLRSTATYRIATQSVDGFRLLQIKDVGPGGFSLAVCNGFFKRIGEVEKANCVNYQQMRLYYDSKPGLIYLPATNAEKTVLLHNDQQQKLQSILGAAEKNKFDVTVFRASKFLDPPNSEIITAMLQRSGKKLSINQVNTPQLSSSSPFQRNFFTIVPTPASPDLSNDKAADCSRTFTSLNQVRQAGSPLLVCKLNLARMALTSIPREVYNYKNLKLLNLGKNPVPETEIAAFRQAMPGCTVIILPASTTPPDVPVVAGRKDLGYVYFDAYNELDGAGKSKIDRLSKYLLANPKAKIEFRTNWNPGKPDDITLAANITFLKNYLKSQGISYTSPQIDIQLVSDPKLKKNVNGFLLTGIRFTSEFQAAK